MNNLRINNKVYIFVKNKNKMSKEKVTSNGIGLGGLIFIVFLVMKLGEIGQVANWSWWWVTSPLWIPLALGLTIISIGFVIALIAYLIK